MLKIEKFVVNPLQENSWVISDETGECVFIDPGFYYDEEFDEIRDYISSRNLKPVKILNTHCHFDHLMGVGFIRNEFGVPFFAHLLIISGLKKLWNRLNCLVSKCRRWNLPMVISMTMSRSALGTVCWKSFMLRGIHPGMWLFTMLKAPRCGPATSFSTEVSAGPICPADIIKLSFQPLKTGCSFSPQKQKCIAATVPKPRWDLRCETIRF
jgi:hypothetical protein